VNISADEFLKLIDQLDAGEAVKADEMFNYYMAAMKSRPNYAYEQRFHVIKSLWLSAITAFSSFVQVLRMGYDVHCG